MYTPSNVDPETSWQVAANAWESAVSVSKCSRLFLVVALIVGAGMSPSFGQNRPGAQRPAAPAAPAAPEPSTPAQSAESTAPLFEVTGFRSARFGMTEAEVRQAAARDFSVRPDQIRQSTNQLERTRVLTVLLDGLDPGPGPASIIYIFGHRSQRLIQVNVVWAPREGQPAAEASQFLLTGVQLTNYFREFRWRDNRAVIGAQVSANTLLMFSAEDEKTGAVQVVADGVMIDRPEGAEGQATAAAPRAPGPPSLRVSYIANRAQPDIYRIERF